ncbi:MAG: hypothetical protein CM1200mP22_19130 [Dehalococcoidia bacterium]|nr:MAG: hypothetical protein CM1200mP22_19130 [Dehalococcoidia bacterium]
MYQRSVLNNKLRFDIYHGAYPVGFHSNCVGAGSRYESEELAGVSHFIEHLPFKGTASWPTARGV